MSLIHERTINQIKKIKTKLAEAKHITDHEYEIVRCHINQFKTMKFEKREFNPELKK